MESKKRILIFAPDGTGIKNYLYSNVFKNTSASISLFHNFDTATLSHLNSEISIDSYLTIPKYKESIKEKFLRELIHTARLTYNAKREANPSILAFQKRNHSTLRLKLFYALVSMAAKLIKEYKSIVKMEKKYDRSLRQNPFYIEVQELIKAMNPDVVFCTHQRALKAPTVFIAANDLGISTVTVIYSWDNIPKARLALRANKYLVWSSYMKNELERMYPEISPEKIIITGTPQFEFYKDSNNIIERSKFYEIHGLDPNKKLICFSGDDVKTSPYDPYYLNDLAESLVKMDDKYQIIFRRCPVDLSKRYEWVLQKFPYLIKEVPPLWNFNSKIWTAVYPVYDDIKLLVSLARYCDVVINVGSTMAFDFGMFQKPCIYINYDHKPDKNWSVETIYNYQHFRSMSTKKAVYWLSSKDEIAQLISEVMNNPKTDIKDWFEIVVNHVDAASDNIIKELE